MRRFNSSISQIFGQLNILSVDDYSSLRPLDRSFITSFNPA